MDRERHKSFNLNENYNKAPSIASSLSDATNNTNATGYSASNFIKMPSNNSIGSSYTRLNNQNNVATGSSPNLISQASKEKRVAFIKDMKKKRSRVDSVGSGESDGKGVKYVDV